MSHDNAASFVEKVPHVIAATQFVPPMFEAFSIFACLFSTILPVVNARSTLLVVRISALECVSILEMYFALAMSAAIDPLPLEHAAVEEECAMTLAPILSPLAIVDGAIFTPHHSKAFLVAALIAKPHVDLAIRKLWWSNVCLVSRLGRHRPRRGRLGDLG
jgi:hypothetical protein